MFHFNAAYSVVGLKSQRDVKLFFFGRTLQIFDRGDDGCSKF